MDNQINIQEIMKLIPHRYPFLLIDKIIDVVPFKSACGIKCVTINENFFNGHFPSHPVMPGVLIIESMAQTAGALVVHSLGDGFAGKLVYFMSIDNAKFRKIVTPGDVLHVKVEVVQSRGPVWKLQGNAYVDGQLCAEALICAMIRDDSNAKIHKTAIIEEGAKIGKNSEIGAYSVIGKNVVIHENVVIHNHVNIAGNTEIGAGTEIYPFASIGTNPQDLKYQGEENRLIIGKNNKIREHTTINPGTLGGGSLTQIGDNCLLMMSSHIAHDCIIGNNVILANNATLAGHVRVDDGAILGGLSAVQQFVHIGAGAMIGGLSGVEKDVIPYGMVYSHRAKLRGINHLGLKRKGFDKEAVALLNKFARSVFFNSDNKTIKEHADNFKQTNHLIDDLRQFLALSHKNGLIEAKDD